MSQKKSSTAPQWAKVRACYRELGLRIEQIRMMDDRPQVLIDALSAWAHYTEVSKYFPDLTHVLTAEAIYCMGYRQAVMFNEGCDCPGTHDCKRWSAVFAREWATKISELVIRGYTEKQLYWVCRSLNSLLPVPGLNELPNPDALTYDTTEELDALDADYRINPLLRVWLFLSFMWREAQRAWEASAGERSAR